jgi:replicative DNA helicase
LDQFELVEAMQHGSIILNYSAELSLAEFGRLVAANLTTTSRLELTEAHFKQASVMLEKAEAKFYVGYNPDLDRIGPVLDSIEWAIRRLGANVVVLDHLHFLTRGERDDHKAQADAMQRIKNMARKWNVIFVVVGQSRKEQPNSKGRQRETSDAKGSETFTSDASAVYHIHRSVNRGIDWNKPETIPQDRLDVVTEITCLKGRSKGSGPSVTRQTFVGQFGKFYPFTTQEKI